MLSSSSTMYSLSAAGSASETFGSATSSSHCFSFSPSTGSMAAAIDCLYEYTGSSAVHKTRWCIATRTAGQVEDVVLLLPSAMRVATR